MRKSSSSSVLAHAKLWRRMRSCWPWRGASCESRAQGTGEEGERGPKVWEVQKCAKSEGTMKMERCLMERGDICMPISSELHEWFVFNNIRRELNRRKWKIDFYSGHPQNMKTHEHTWQCLLYRVSEFRHTRPMHYKDKPYYANVYSGVGIQSVGVFYILLARPLCVDSLLKAAFIVLSISN